jgi:hypothetical protein
MTKRGQLANFWPFWVDLVKRLADATREQWKSWKSLKLHSMEAKDGITLIF